MKAAHLCGPSNPSTVRILSPKVQKEINKALGRPGSDMGEFLVPETRGIVKERENFRRLRERKSELGTK